METIKKIDWKRKLSSRKLWVAVVGIVTGLAVALGCDAGAIADVAGAVIAAVSAVSYIVVEGKIDAAAVGNAADKIDKAVDAIEGADA